MEEAVSPSILKKGEPRVVAVRIVDLSRNGKGQQMIKAMLVPVLETIEQLCSRIQKETGFGGRNDLIKIYDDLFQPVERYRLVRSLNLSHNCTVLCSLSPVEHWARCTRCKQAPILGTRYHVSGYSVDLCSKHAELAPRCIKRLLKPLYVPHEVHDGIVSTHNCPISYSNAYDWLCSVDGPYKNVQEVDDALEQGAKLVQEQDGHLVWTWPRKRDGSLITRLVPHYSC